MKLSNVEKRSANTAIHRGRKLSSPTRWLYDNGCLVGRVLDYGCGFGEDADYLGLEKHDPFYYPGIPNGLFDTIICNYVLNTLPIENEQEVLSRILSKLRVGGNAYITVRRDIKKDGMTSKGTYQRRVNLDLPVLHKTGWYIMYQLKNEKNNEKSLA